MNAICKLLNIKKQKYIKDLFSCTGIYKEKKMNLNKLAITNQTSSEVKNINDILEYFSINNNKTKIFLDLCEIDDKNYHSGVRFTFFAHNLFFIL